MNFLELRLRIHGSGCGGIDGTAGSCAEAPYLLLVSPMTADTTDTHEWDRQILRNRVLKPRRGTSSTEDCARQGQQERSLLQPRSIAASP